MHNKQKNIIKTILLFFIVFFPKFSYSQIDLRTCGFNCTSNNYSLNDVFLSFTDVYGFPISNTICDFGTNNQVYILMNYTSNSNSNIYFTRLFADLSIDGMITPINIYLGTINPGIGQKKIFGPFNWVCGQELTLSNILVAWKTNANNDPGNNYSCGDYSSSQCDFSQNMSISKPLSVRFTYNACTFGNITTVNFFSNVSGGFAPYTYAWDFDSNGTIDATTANPTHEYTNTNSFIAKLIITDSQGLVNSFSQVINFPLELNLSVNVTNLCCFGNSTGSINLTVSGGNPGYSYLWSNGMTSQNISNLTFGNYSVTVTDSKGCQKTGNYTILNGDTTNPVVTAPLNYSINGCCTNAITVFPYSTSETIITMSQFLQAGGSVIDNSNSLIISYKDSITGSCPIIVTRTFKIKDECNNIGIANEIINILDTTSPTFSAPSNTTIHSDAACTFDASILVTGDVLDESDNCSTNLQATYSDSISDGTCEGSKIITRTWSLVDSCGNLAPSQTQLITVLDTIAPTFSAPSNITINSDAACTFDASILVTGDVLDESDNCSTNLQATYSDSISDGLCEGSKIITRTWSLVDSCGNSASSQTQLITVLDEIAPTFSAPSNITIDSDAACTFDASILVTGDVLDEIDNCSTNLQATFLDSISDGLCEGSKIITRTWSLVDSCGNLASSQTQLITVLDTIAPTFSAPSNTTIYSDSSCNFDASILVTGDVLDESDNCSTNLQATFLDSISDGLCEGSKIITRTWSLVDSCGNLAPSQTQLITVLDTIAPTFSAPSNTTIYSDAACTFDASILVTGDVLDESDNCSTNLQATYSDSISDGLCEGSKVITRTWSLVDSCGNSAPSQTQLITVLDTIAPTFSAPSNTTIDSDAACNFDASILVTGDVLDESDNCSTNLQATYSDSISDGTCEGSKVITRTWSLVDSCGNLASSQTQIITVLDTISPTFSAPSNITIDSDAACNFDASILVTGDVLDESDNCSTNLQATFLDSISDGTCEGSKVITRTWSLVDSCGNLASSQTQIITVLDTISPTFITNLPPNINVSCDLIPPSPNILATDNCGTVTLNYNETRIDGICPSNYILNRTWTATDACGNSNLLTQTITVSDTEAPTVLGSFDSIINVNCDEIPTIPNVTFTDNCTGMGNVIFPNPIDSIINRTDDSYTIIREWIASDLCGNSNTFTQTINVTIIENTIPISQESCNDLEEIINLNMLISEEFRGQGEWIDLNNSGGFNGQNEGFYSCFGMPIGNYRIEYKVETATCPKKFEIEMNVLSDCLLKVCGDLVIHNAISPNDDGLNDIFTIDNLQDFSCYTSNKVEIYNRWGILVYETNNYDNNNNSFKGISEGRTTINKFDKLPSGTYFYILQYIFEGKSYKKDGYLYLSR